MPVRCKEMTERLKIIGDREFAACNLELLNRVGCPGVLVKVDRPCAQMDASGGVRRPGKPVG